MAMRTIIGIAVVMLLAVNGRAQDPALAPDLGDDGRGTPYVVDKTDNICGIDEPRAITSPARVDYDEVLAATEEVRTIKRRRIDPESAKVIKLMTEARRKVLAACESVRSDEGYCSVWKDIERRDKTPVDDVTEKVKAKLTEDGEASAPPRRSAASAPALP